MTPAQHEALVWLRERGGDGVFMRGNCVLARGETGPFTWATWKALIAAGHCVAYSAGKGRRIKLGETPNV